MQSVLADYVHVDVLEPAAGHRYLLWWWSYVSYDLGALVVYTFACSLPYLLGHVGPKVKFAY